MKSSRNHSSDAVVIRRTKSVRRDATYHMGQENRGRKRDANGSIAYVRADTDKPESTAILMNERVLRESNLSPRRVRRALVPKIANIAGNRPVVAMDDPLSPKVVTTPGGRQLVRIVSLQSISVFASSHQFKLPAQPVQRKADVHPGFFASSPYRAVRKPSTEAKEQTMIVTPELIKEVRRESKGKRRKGQNNKMAEEGHEAKEASATRYVQATELFSAEMIAEWGHLLAHRFKGEASTIVDNLVAMTYDMNTMMVFVEDEVQELTKMYPQGFKYSSRADLIPGTHFAPAIYMTLETDDFKFPLVIRVDMIKPNIVFKEYIRCVMQALVIAGKSKYQVSAAALDNEPAGSPIHSLLFFNSSQAGTPDAAQNNIQVCSPTT